MSVIIDGSAGIDLGSGSLTFPDNTSQTTTYQSIGVGQTWNTYVIGPSGRQAGTTYTNTTGRPILVCIFASDGGATSTGAYLNTVQIAANYGNSTGGYGGSTMTFIVPPGAEYKVTLGSNSSVGPWSELR